jgi:hypothetical protein
MTQSRHSRRATSGQPCRRVHVMFRDPLSDFCSRVESSRGKPEQRAPFMAASVALKYQVILTKLV